MDEPVQPIMLPSLQLLAVDFELGHASDLSAVIKFIHAPSLISMLLTGWYLDAPHSSIVGETHFPALQHLILGSTVTDAIPKFGLLAKAFPNIERLTCRVEDEDISDILANITEPGDELRWPKLQSIGMSNVVGTLFGWQVDDLCKLIIRSQQAGRPFRQLLYPISGSGFALAWAGDVHKLRELVELADFKDDWPTPFECVI
ncbi:hypothetical protein FIBSPDRAFT_883980 [Athelia psychrophila]|uniref:Uncharacterized protein n=1 Tax=Athelia psychrophila TaxID=1759441 RepID=A0A166TQN8_9AGAM|nr:hypothetical protein FIBSPDRAFT_883980 [Fibularhizoctonia sp. CBS 109695]